jgi:2-alkyl-3-oxoalkanoate reductase
MKLFVAGATGVLGRPTVARLAEAGHDVRAVARTPAKAELVRRLGATPVEADLFDPASVRRVVDRCEAVLHLATSIPPTRRAVRRSAWAMNDRLRRVATRVLVDAALDAGADRFVKEAIAFVYEGDGDRWLDEESPVLDTPVIASAFDAEREVARFSDGGGTGVVLRFGLFHGPEASTTDDALRLAKLRVAFPMIGDGNDWFPTIHTDDAADAVVAALRAPAGLYNATGPAATKREFTDAFSAAFGLPRLRLLPAALARAGGRAAVTHMLRSQRVSARRFTEATGWGPRHGDIRTSWAAVAAAREAPVG